MNSTFLPTSMREVKQRGWDTVDVVFVTGDAYVDHPGFAMAILGRWLEKHGYRVAILSQPDWHSCEAWREFGAPRLCFAVSAGNMDSMINHYTANRKVRNDDAYSPGGAIGRRPDRATLSYCQRAREAYRDVPVIAGGVEASLRRIAHYDYWSDKVRRSIILDAKADLLVYGMGERPLLEIVQRLDRGEPIRSIRDVRGTVYRLGASESLPEESVEQESIELPTYDEVRDDPEAFARMTRMAYLETNPSCARRLIQRYGRETLIVNRPQLPLSESEIDEIYGLPFTRKSHPSYREPIPALQVVETSVQIMRGCFGGCAFCSLTAHQGRVIQSRSEQSILDELRQIADSPDFHGTISDLGGPSANMYRMNCGNAKRQAVCRRTSCLHPEICKHLNTNHGPLIELMKTARKMPGVKQVHIASGVRTDLAQCSRAYMSQLVRHHIGGHLKTAPEHADPGVLQLMKKPPIESYDRFAAVFVDVSQQIGSRQYLVPYFISGHPGSDLKSMVRLAEYLKMHHIRPQQVQDFIPGPFDLATCMYHTGLDPMTGQKVHVPSGGRERRLQRALLQYFKPENYRDVREAIETIGREDLIGTGPNCLIGPSEPRNMDRGVQKKKTGKRSQRRKTGADNPHDSVGKSGTGYRPKRKTSRRR